MLPGWAGNAVHRRTSSPRASISNNVVDSGPSRSSKQETQAFDGRSPTGFASGAV